MITTVVCDFGGVLTNRLSDAFAAYQDETGISSAQLGRGMQKVAERDGEYPLFRLERGEVSEHDFLEDLAWGLEDELGHRPHMHSFTEIYFKALIPNEAMIGLMHECKAAGYRMALLTNNVREWEPLWRAKLDVDAIFELVVDSAFVGMRKPEPPIYELTLQRLGGVPAQESIFIDDNELNVVAARDLGMTAVQFLSNEQAIPEIRGHLEKLSG